MQLLNFKTVHSYRAVIPLYNSYFWTIAFVEFCIFSDFLVCICKMQQKVHSGYKMSEAANQKQQTSRNTHIETIYVIF